ncbi:hypothetical protein LINGRAHAP2_LOCUS4522, partial [Linum grandiflorum]
LIQRLHKTSTAEDFPIDLELRLKAYPSSENRSVDFGLRFIKTSKHFSFIVIPRIRLSPLHYQVLVTLLH